LASDLEAELNSVRKALDQLVTQHRSIHSRWVKKKKKKKHEKTQKTRKKI